MMQGNLTTIWFKFNMEAMEVAGTTGDEVLAPIREYTKSKGISESEYGLFTLPKDKISYYRMHQYLASHVVKHPECLQFFEAIISTVDDKDEECLPSLKELINSLDERENEEEKAMSEKIVKLVDEIREELRARGEL